MTSLNRLLYGERLVTEAVGPGKEIIPANQGDFSRQNHMRRQLVQQPRMHVIRRAGQVAFLPLASAPRVYRSPRGRARLCSQAGWDMALRPSTLILLALASTLTTLLGLEVLLRACPAAWPRGVYGRPRFRADLNL